MVSYSEVGDRSLAVRRAPSVSSRTSTTRQRRHHRSHHGGSSYQPQNDFPVFSNTGDVEIVLQTGAKEQRYLLHRLILAQCSGFFEAGTSHQWCGGQGDQHALGSISETDSASGTAAGSSASKLAEPDKRRWRYELDKSVDDEVPMLVQKNPSTSLFGGDQTPRSQPSRTRPATSSPGLFRSSAANVSAMHVPHTQALDDPANDMLRDYDNLFRIFYNYSPALDVVNIANAYIECKSLLQLADMYDAQGVVGPRIDHHLLQFQGRLWKQIAKYPPSYLKLGYLARSKVIFSEALVHVVGQWPSGANHLRSQLPEHVMDVVEDKVDELEELKNKVEGKLFRLTLTTPRGERVTPLNAHLEWTAVSLFRQWFAENTTPPPTPNHKDVPRMTDGRVQPPLPPTPRPPNTGRIYRLIGTGGSAYLAHDELKRFLKLRPDDYTRENMRRFEKRMGEIKNMAREIVRPLMRNFLELDLGRDGVNLGYVTCTKVEERDFPWDQ
ncbi:MAG: hypothetical protein M1817_001960 [Caeruleum heppii]|nr:MAG: hypothetical protein M1817_001960 [Caeruleum heppii]